MPILEQVYRRLDHHEPASSWRAGWAIGDQCGAMALKGWFPKGWLAVSQIPGLVAAVIIYGMTRNESLVLEAVNGMARTGYQSFNDVPGETWYRVASNLVYAMITIVQGWFATVGTAIYGARQVADDLRTSAFEVYVARPIWSRDYVIGKLIAVVKPLLFILIVPTGFCLLAANLFVPASAGPCLKLYPILIMAGIAYATLNAIVILGISSLGKSSRYATITWFVLYFLTMAVSVILTQTTGESVYEIVSYRANLQVILASFLRLNPFEGLDLEFPSPDHSLASSALIIGCLAALSLFLVLRRVRSGRLP